MLERICEMQINDEFLDNELCLYLSFETCYEINIMQLYCFSIHIVCVNITAPVQFCTMYEKCKFLSMGY